MVAGGGYGGFDDAAPLTHALGINLIAYWSSGNGALTPGMADLVDYWRRWHVVKVVISVSLTCVFALLATVLWGTRRRTPGFHQRPLVSCAGNSLKI